ncbi:MAG: phosphatase PAP2 family protein [Gemmatimonadetes bacterium]|nr:phosphatase PAP2 family protein [Gemmatimonadota bacterium]
MQQTQVRPASGLFAALGRFVHARWKRLAVLFGGVLVPLLAFGDLAEDVWVGGVFQWDAPILRYLHAFSTPARDRAMEVVSLAGYEYGVIPLAGIVFLALLARGRRGDALFFGVAMAGTGALNQSGKLFFQRARPDLWLSPAPEHTFSFPSGHAMGSMALAAALAVLAWPTRWRWWAIGIGGLFTLVVGLSRVYLGVHYPSDVLAGWLASLAWVVGLSTVAYGRAAKPVEQATPVAAGRDPDPPAREDR